MLLKLTLQYPGTQNRRFHWKFPLEFSSLNVWVRDGGGAQALWPKKHGECLLGPRRCPVWVVLKTGHFPASSKPYVHLCPLNLKGSSVDPQDAQVANIILLAETTAFFGLKFRSYSPAGVGLAHVLYNPRGDCPRSHKSSLSTFAQRPERSAGMMAASCRLRNHHI